MSTPLRPDPLDVRVLAGLLDDAALFPPGNAPMTAALRAHAEHLRAWYAPLVGPFLCPASRLDELRALVGQPTADGPEEPLPVGVVVDTGTGGLPAAVGRVRADDRLDLVGVEVALRGGELQTTARRTVAALDDADVRDLAAVEVPREPGWQGALDVVAEAGARAKLRTGGATLDAVPTEVELAAFVTACLDRELAFKLTAGLHHAVRHRSSPHDEVPGQEQHGFVNVLAATATALDGATDSDVTAVLGSRDAAALAARLTAEQVTRARRWFTSFGTCSTLEPVEGLIAVGLLTASERSQSTNA